MRAYHDPFLRFLANSSRMENEQRNCQCRPATNVMEDENAFRIEMMVPGYSKKDIKINIEKNMLIVSSELQNEKEGDNVTYTRREFVSNDFSRSFELPETIDQDGIKADYKNGILTLTLPKKEEVKIKKEIQIA
jgi:HSP20 family protein